jgi:hypothetical protein
MSRFGRRRGGRRWRQLARRRARAERERRLEGWRWMCWLQSVSVTQHPGGRVPSRAGVACHDDRERLSLREAIEWCGGEITLREATRLGRLVSDP